MECASREPSRSSRAFALAFVMAIGSAIGACEGPTSIAVSITADVPCAALRGVTIQAGAPSMPPRSETTTTQCRDEAGPAGSVSNVGTIVIVPDEDREAEVAIRVLGGTGKEVAACRDGAYDGCIVARRWVRFVSGKELDLPVTLRGACASVACDGGTTCVRGTCVSARVTSSDRCVGTTCDENGFGGAAPPSSSAARCGSGEKSCDDKCVSAADPKFGCTRVGCTPCAGNDIADFACGVDTCRLVACRDGSKACGDSCVAPDVEHGCGNASCTPCESANGKASCGATGQCELACDAGYKLCGGRCVNVNDPTYGCTATGCDANTCPAPGVVNGGTLVCDAGKCVLGACPPGTKACNQRCVPTDASNGCEEASRCTACGTNETCQGMPTKCQCNAEPLTTTCKLKACGPATNNCKQPVTCPDTCVRPNVCNGGQAGKNGCGCTTPATACSGVPCGATTLDTACNVYVVCTPELGCYNDPGGSGG